MSKRWCVNRTVTVPEKRLFTPPQVAKKIQMTMDKQRLSRTEQKLRVCYQPT